jgi:transcriptional regulator with XRE-family HTH domain
VAASNPIYTPEHRALVELLRAYRERKGLRQVDVARALGRPQSYVSTYESGQKNLDFVEVWRICEAIGIPFGKVTQHFARVASGQPRRRPGSW